MIKSSDFVVLDVETNGLSALRDDLLSVSFYDPESEEGFEFFLPLTKFRKMSTLKKIDLYYDKIFKLYCEIVHRIQMSSHYVSNILKGHYKEGESYVNREKYKELMNVQLFKVFKFETIDKETLNLFLNPGEEKIKLEYLNKIPFKEIFDKMKEELRGVVDDFYYINPKIFFREFMGKRISVGYDLKQSYFEEELDIYLKERSWSNDLEFKLRISKFREAFLRMEEFFSKNPITFHINGITEKDLKDAKPITQKKWDELYEKLNLKDRKILHYGNIDYKFLKKYFEEKEIVSKDLFFYNIKSSEFLKFGHGNYSKDNLCNILGIEGVTDVHNGLNDCILEWKLFKRLEENPIRKYVDFEDGEVKTYLAENTTNDFLIPATVVRNFSNSYTQNQLMKKYELEWEILSEKRTEISEELSHFTSNMQLFGVIIEKKLNNKLENVRISNNKDFHEINTNYESIAEFTFKYETPDIEKKRKVLVNIDKNGKYELLDHNISFLQKILLQLKNLTIDREFYKTEFLDSAVNFINDTIKDEITRDELVKSDIGNYYSILDYSSEENSIELKTTSLSLERVIEKNEFQFIIQTIAKKNSYGIFFLFESDKNAVKEVIVKFKVRSKDLES